MAHQLEEAAGHQAEERIISSLNVKQYIYYGILCFGGSVALSAADIACLCELKILAHNLRVFSHDSVWEVESVILRARCLNMMAGRNFEIMQHAPNGDGLRPLPWGLR